MKDDGSDKCRNQDDWALNGYCTIWDSLKKRKVKVSADKTTGRSVCVEADINSKSDGSDEVSKPGRRGVQWLLHYKGLVET